MAFSSSGAFPRAPPRFNRQNRNSGNTNSNNNSRRKSFSSIWKNQRSMFVVDPKTLATRFLVRRSNFDEVLDSTNTRLVRFFVWLKSLSENWFTHLFLLIALILYAFIGGAIFSTIEGSYEQEENAIIERLQEPIDEMANEIIESLWIFRQQFPLPPDNENSAINRPLPIHPVWYREVMNQLQVFNQTTMNQCAKRLNYSIERFTTTNRWDFIDSVFFSMTVFTTIGYGDNPPITKLGKTATMIYSFFGIPLLLIVLADFGKIFTKTIKYIIMFFRRIYYDKSLRTVRHMSRRANRAAKIQAAVIQAYNKIQRAPPFFIDKKTGRVTLIPPNKISQTDVEQPQLIRENLSSQPQVPLRRSKTIPMMTISPSTPNLTPDTPMPVMLDFDDMDDEFNLPISLALFILMLYLFLGAILFWTFERWTLFQAFYFVFISMSTIGFGDFVPTKFNVLLCAFMYFLFGLALTSMCINVIQEKLSSTFEKARVTIGESFGLDPTTPVTIINNNSSKKSTPEKSTDADNAIDDQNFLQPST